MKTTHLMTLAGGLLAAGTASALTLEIQNFGEGEPIPAGYQNVTDGVDAEAVINVSSDPFVDYLIPSNSGSAGITAQKFGGEYITSSTAAEMGGNNGGANSLIDPDAYQVVFAWEDGDPLPFGEDYYGVSWANWGADTVATLETRIELAAEEEVTVYHWFNDGWNYADGGHNVLAGHNITVTQYTADGTEVSSESAVLSSGGAESFFGDHRQFYSGIIKATRTAPGDYLIIENEGGNIGYKGTAVALLGDTGGNTGPGDFSDYELVDGWVDSGSFMGWVYVESHPWVFPLALDKWIYAGGEGWFFVEK
jgi:hypothetical protein